MIRVEAQGDDGAPGMGALFFVFPASVFARRRGYALTGKAQRRKVDSLCVVVPFRFAEPLPPGSAEPQLGMERSGFKLGYSIAIA